MKFRNMYESYELQCVASALNLNKGNSYKTEESHDYNLG